MSTQIRERPKKILHKSPVKLIRDYPINDDVWPEGLWPLVTRGMDPLGEWLHGSEIRIEPAIGVWYETRKPVGDGWVRLYNWDSMVKVLVPPGEYHVTFRHPDVTVENVIVIETPLEKLHEITFRDGLPLWCRDESWDDYIIKEEPYRKLLSAVRPGDVVMDAGAHIGTFARDALRAGAGGVICYEPETINARLLRRNVAGMPVTVAEGCLVGDDASSVQLWIDGGDVARNALNSVARTRGNRVPVRVPAWNFTSELQRVNPAIVKVDVEEAEWAYSWEMPASVRALAVELERPAAHEEEIARICACLGAQGFDPVRSPGSKGWATMGVWRRRGPG